jgi:hypothetical protein
MARKISDVERLESSSTVRADLPRTELGAGIYSPKISVASPKILIIRMQGVEGSKPPSSGGESSANRILISRWVRPDGVLGAASAAWGRLKH